MAHRADPAELLDVDVDELAWVRALVAANRLGRLRRLQGVEPKTQNTADRGRRNPDPTKGIMARIGSSGVIGAGERSVSMARMRKAKGFRKIEGPEEYLIV